MESSRCNNTSNRLKLSPILFPPSFGSTDSPLPHFKTFNFQVLNLSQSNVRGLQILKFCRPFNNYLESDNLICIN